MSRNRIALSALFYVLFSSHLAFAAFRVGATVGNLCFPEVSGKMFCTQQDKTKFKILMFNAGWCGPCNEEMATVRRLAPSLENLPVTLVSLSLEGFSAGAPADKKFLTTWKLRHHFSGVVASGTFGQAEKFAPAPIAIPFSVVIDPKGRYLFYGDLSLAIEEVKSHAMKATPLSAPRRAL